MFTEERDSPDVLIGVVIVALAVGGIYTMKRDTPETVPATPLAVSTSSPATPRIEVGHGSIAKSADSVIAVAYECWRDGKRILSDGPCGPDAATRTIPEPNRMDRQDVSGLYVHAASSARAAPTRTTSSSSAADRCAEIERQIDTINTRMRHRYTSPEGERFRARLRDLSRARYEAMCIR
jgi:hypothetical protein